MRSGATAMRGWWCVVMIAVVSAAACRRAPSDRAGGVGDGGAPDTVRGIVQVVGNDPVTSVMLVPTDTTRAADAVSLQGDALPLVRAANGLEIMVRGRRLAARDVAAAPRGAPVFDVTTFVVRAADGVVAFDGVLERAGTAYVLRTADGAARPITQLPGALTGAVGARVYLVGTVAAPTSWGVLRAP